MTRILDAVSGLKRGKWISAAIACELPREVPETDLYYGLSVTCKCGGTFDAYQTHDEDGKPSSWYIPFHPKGGDEEARAAIEKRGNEAVDEAVIAAYEAGRASVMVTDITTRDGETICGADCDDCRARSKSDLCAGQPNATRCTRPVAFAIRPVGHRVPTYRCTQCYCQYVIDRNTAWRERYDAFQRAKTAERERDEARAQAAAMREALERVRFNHQDSHHHPECPARGHIWGDCECPGDTTDETAPCVDGECECCMSVDIIHDALDPDAGRALVEELARLRIQANDRNRMVEEWTREHSRADAAEKRAGELEAALHELRALWHSPNTNAGYHIIEAALAHAPAGASDGPFHSADEDCGCFACPRAACYDGPASVNLDSRSKEPK